MFIDIVKTCIIIKIAFAKMLNERKVVWREEGWPLLFVVVIVIAFAVITACGFVWNDDYWMSYGIHSLKDVFNATKDFYFNWGGGLFSVAMQYVFCGLLKNQRAWFVIANTLFFILLIIISSKLISKKNNNASATQVLSFALLFWFLCPSPSQTVFWAVGSTGYLWATVLVLAFLVVFEKYKDSNFGVVGKFALLVFSVTMAGNTIPCVSICGAFVLYYLFHIKEFKGNVVPLVIGFALGSIILVFAPGNFVRLEEENWGGGVSLFGRIWLVISHPISEAIKYKALWLFIVTLFLGYRSDKERVKQWMKENSILLLSLAWSMIAFSVVFRPEVRALFFTETLSIILMLRFYYDNKDLFVKYLNNKIIIKKKILFLVFGVLFLFDAGLAVRETLTQRSNNEKLLEQLVKCDGVGGLDRPRPSHRMAYAPIFHKWTWEALADEYGFDSVLVYPDYCQDKYYSETSQFKNVYLDENSSYGKDVSRIIVRIPFEELKTLQCKVTFTIAYDRPQKWYKQWLDKWRNYKYDRVAVVEMDKPDAFFDGYVYYVIWFRRENAKQLKSIEYVVQ